MDPKDKFYVQSVHRALRIIDTISHNDNKEATINSLSGELQLHPSTVYRLIQNLISMKYISEVKPGQYRLGMAFLRLGEQVHQSIDLVNIAKKHLLRLNELTKETVYLAIYEQKTHKVLYVDKLEGHGNIKLVSSIGRHNGIYCTANGKAILSGFDEKTIRNILDKTDLVAKTDFTITDPDRLIQEIHAVSVRGYALDIEESEYNVACIAAPIRDFSKKNIASVSISGMVKNITCVENLQYFSELVIETAENLSYDLGYRKDSASL